MGLEGVLRVSAAGSKRFFYSTEASKKGRGGKVGRGGEGTSSEACPQPARVPIARDGRSKPMFAFEDATTHRLAVTAFMSHYPIFPYVLRIWISRC